MIFDISSTDEWDNFWSENTNREAIREYLRDNTIELNSLEELIDFIKKIKCPIVVSMFDEDTPEIEIYNGYRE